MKIKICFYPFAIMGLLLMLVVSCKKDDNNDNPTVAGTVKDIDGNFYHTVTIGKQVWMVENLKTTRYNDSTSIPLVTIGWSNLITPGYCWYNNDIRNQNIYGALYNWHAVGTGKLAPIGWHVPTDAEWTNLITFLGGDSIAPGKLKEAGTNHWAVHNKDATNETGFTWLPGGHRSWGGSFAYINSYGDIWSSSTEQDVLAWGRSLYSNASYIDRGGPYKRTGMSVRCLKN